jgi:precorrin-2 dehydrogenase/sirohydrochlorin ferrochelatase
MVPVALDPTALAMAVVGRGQAALRRFLALRAGGATDLLLFSDQSDGLEAVPWELHRPFLPSLSDVARLRALWITGLPIGISQDLATMARSERVLVNVEDRPELCDFHSVAEVRRGDLLLTVSTGGASPGLSARIRARLAAEFGPEWAGRVSVLRECRKAWRGQGRDVTAQTNALLQANGWLA